MSTSFFEKVGESTRTFLLMSDGSFPKLKTELLLENDPVVGLVLSILTPFPT